MILSTIENNQKILSGSPGVFLRILISLYVSAKMISIVKGFRVQPKMTPCVILNLQESSLKRTRYLVPGCPYIFLPLRFSPIYKESL